MVEDVTTVLVYESVQVSLLSLSSSSSRLSVRAGVQEVVTSPDLMNPSQTQSETYPHPHSR